MFDDTVQNDSTPLWRKLGGRVLPSLRQATCNGASRRAHDIVKDSVTELIRERKQSIAESERIGEVYDSPDMLTLMGMCIIPTRRWGSYHLFEISQVKSRYKPPTSGASHGRRRDRQRQNPPLRRKRHYIPRSDLGPGSVDQAPRRSDTSTK